MLLLALVSAAPAWAGEPRPPFLSDGVVHYDLVKVPTVPEPCLLFENGKGETERYGPCGEKTLEDYLGPEAKWNGGMAVVFPGGREWRLSRRIRSDKLAAVPEKLFREAGFSPEGPLASKEVPGALYRTVQVGATKIAAKEAASPRLGACVAFEVAGYYYGILVTGADAATIEGDLAEARASIAVVENPNVARYSGAVVYAIAVGLGMAGLVAVVSIVLVRSARAAKKKELEAAEAMARAWTDRAR